MIEFLNETIGADAATYIGALLGLIGLFVGGKIIRTKTAQTQKIKNGSGIQANGDVTININKEEK